MILFFRTPQQSVIATAVDHQLTQDEINELCWLYGDAKRIEADSIDGFFVGPRREMITPWSTNAVEITQNMSLHGISRIEEYFPASSKDADHDPMLQRMYEGLDQDIFTVNHQPEPIKHVEDLEAYNEQEGLALSPEEIEYLHKVQEQVGRPLTDSEIFGFAQINSEHCRHKIFGGTFVIDGVEMESSLFQMIKKTTKENPNKILSAYKDNVAFAQGPVVEQFAPKDQSTSDYFQVKDIESVISLKAETHNFPTTVEPFNGAATGTGGEIRDRMGGGVGSWPIAGTAVYMTAYPRLDDKNVTITNDVKRDWEEVLPVRKWLYQTPEQILIKASNGASDFGNKFGQPLICGSVLTFEHQEGQEKYAYDKVIMLAGGVGYGTKRDCLKKAPQKGNKVVVVGGDNYRIGLGGGSVSSVDTGRYSNGIELNAVQRANPEMQKRAYNLVRALCEEDVNPVVSIHDHGSAGHLNCLSELVEECGGEVSDVKKVVSPVLVNDKNSSLYHIDFSFDEQALGGSAFAQSLGKVGSDVPTVKDAEYFADCFNAVQDLIKKGWVMAGHDISAGGLITTLLEMCFANTEGGMHINLHDIVGDDMVKVLMAENPGVVIQVSDKHKDEFKKYMEEAGIDYAKIGYPTPAERTIVVKKDNYEHTFDINALRDEWYKTSWLLDRKQSFNGCADERVNNYKNQPLEMKFNDNFSGTLKSYGISADRRTPSGIKAAIIREKGTNGEREMAYSLYLAGFDVKDVMMTDLITGRETLEDVNMIVFCGGFSNSDVLGSAKGWAGAFLFNPKAKEALDRFYAREDTLSLGICNGCQLMVELNLINPEHAQRAKMLHNNSHKFESTFLSLQIPENNSVMFSSLSGSKLGIWVAHGEGKFSLPEAESQYNVVAKYNYAQYPGNPNGSDYNVAGICSNDGRHLAMMPHLERAIFPWQNAWYPADRRADEVTPWIEAFVNARKWVEAKLGK